MTKRSADVPSARRRSNPLIPFLAAGIVLAVLIGAVAHQLAQRSGPEGTPLAAQTRPPANPNAEAAAAGATPNLSVPPTVTPGPVPTRPTPTPKPTLAPPDWDQVYGALGASVQGTGLLVLHTNDSWGYLDPCG